MLKFCNRNFKKQKWEYLEVDRRYFYDFIVAHALLSLLDFPFFMKHIDIFIHTERDQLASQITQ